MTTNKQQDAPEEPREGQPERSGGGPSRGATPTPRLRPEAGTKGCFSTEAQAFHPKIRRIPFLLESDPYSSA
jgi:hypothetical protein